MSELEEIEREDNFRLKRFKEFKGKKNKKKDDKNKNPCCCKKEPSRGDNCLCSSCKETEKRRNDSVKRRYNSKQAPIPEMLGDKPSIVIPGNKNHLDDLKYNLEKVISLTAICKSEGLVSPSIDRFIKACEKEKSKIENKVTKQTVQNDTCECYVPKNSEISTTVCCSEKPEKQQSYTCENCSSKSQTLEQDISLGSFETKIEEIVKVKKSKHEDGTISEEKQVITIKTERKHPQKLNVFSSSASKSSCHSEKGNKTTNKEVKNMKSASDSKTIKIPIKNVPDVYDKTTSTTTSSFVCYPEKTQSGTGSIRPKPSNLSIKIPERTVDNDELCECKTEIKPYIDSCYPKECKSLTESNKLKLCFETSEPSARNLRTGLGNDEHKVETKLSNSSCCPKKSQSEVNYKKSKVTCCKDSNSLSENPSLRDASCNCKVVTRSSIHSPKERQFETSECSYASKEKKSSSRPYICCPKNNSASETKISLKPSNSSNRSSERVLKTIPCDCNLENKSSANSDLCCKKQYRNENFPHKCSYAESRNVNLKNNILTRTHSTENNSIEFHCNQQCKKKKIRDTCGGTNNANRKKDVSTCPNNTEKEQHAERKIKYTCSCVNNENDMEDSICTTNIGIEDVLCCEERKIKYICSCSNAKGKRDASTCTNNTEIEQREETKINDTCCCANNANGKKDVSTCTNNTENNSIELCFDKEFEKKKIRYTCSCPNNENKKKDAYICTVNADTEQREEKTKGTCSCADSKSMNMNTKKDISSCTDNNEKNKLTDISCCTGSKPKIANPKIDVSSCKINIEVQNGVLQDRLSLLKVKPCNETKNVVKETDRSPNTCCKIRVISKENDEYDGIEENEEEIVFYGSVLDAINQILICSESEESFDNGSKEKICTDAVRKTSLRSNLLTPMCKTCASSSPVLSHEIVISPFVPNEAMKRSNSCPVCSTKKDEKSVSWKGQKSVSDDNTCHNRSFTNKDVSRKIKALQCVKSCIVNSLKQKESDGSKGFSAPCKVEPTKNSATCTSCKQIEDQCHSGSKVYTQVRTNYPYSKNENTKDVRDSESRRYPCSDMMKSSKDSIGPSTDAGNVEMKDASTSTRLSDRYDVRTLKMLTAPRKHDCARNAQSESYLTQKCRHGVPKKNKSYPSCCDY